MVPDVYPTTNSKWQLSGYYYYIIIPFSVVLDMPLKLGILSFFFKVQAYIDI